MLNYVLKTYSGDWDCRVNSCSSLSFFILSIKGKRNNSINTSIDAMKVFSIPVNISMWFISNHSKLLTGINIH